MNTFKLNLKPITLICVDCVNFEGAKLAMDVCMGHAEFGDAKLLTSIDTVNETVFDTVKIDPITSIQYYSKFMLTRLNEFVNTEFALVIQYDGFIVNKSAWNAQFYKYDYIGAPWGHHPINNLVTGNGGFSLRSKKLLEACANFDWDVYHPEDDSLCRRHGKEFQDMGYKFAPEKIAKTFSWEPYPRYPKYDGQFGFHSKYVLEHLIKQNKQEEDGKTTA